MAKFKYRDKEKQPKQEDEEDHKPKDFERFQCTSPNEKRSKSPNKFDPKVLAESSLKHKKERAQSAKQFDESLNKSTSDQQNNEGQFDENNLSDKELQLLQWVFKLLPKVNDLIS